MKRHLSHLFLALSFAMLQCIAPLAHAHTGDSVEHGIHLPQAEAEARIIQEDLLQCCIAEAEESAAVVVSEGCERENQIPAPDAQAMFAPPVFQTLAAPVAATLPEAGRDATPLPSVSFRRPYPHAPPAAIEL